MKIAIASSSLPPGFGISVYVDELSKCLHKQGHNIKVFVTDTYDYSLETYEYPVHFTKIPVSEHDEFKYIEEFYNAIMHFNPDALLINDCIYASNILPFISPTCARISIVHGYRERFGLDGHKLVTSVAIHNYEYLDWIVGTSNSICTGLSRKYGINHKMIKLIYNGIEPHQPDSSNSDLKVDKLKRTIVFAGGSNPTKGSDVFLKALKILDKRKYNNLKVVWIGGEEHPPKALKKSGLLEKFVVWTGTIPIMTLREILSNSHILAMPSRAEACPMLLIDALSMGIVPVVSDCPSAMREIVHEGNCGLVSKVGSHINLANCISELISNPSNIDEKSICAKEYFKKNLIIDRTCENLLNIIKERPSNFPLPQKIFPNGNLYAFHRRKYKYTKWNPLGLYERWKLINGFLPKLSKKL